MKQQALKLLGILPCSLCRQYVITNLTGEMKGMCRNSDTFIDNLIGKIKYK